jgi:hypothetical protein
MGLIQWSPDRLSKKEGRTPLAPSYRLIDKACLYLLLWDSASLHTYYRTDRLYVLCKLCCIFIVSASPHTSISTRAQFNIYMVFTVYFKLTLVEKTET